MKQQQKKGRGHLRTTEAGRDRESEARTGEHRDTQRVSSRRVDHKDHWHDSLARRRPKRTHTHAISSRSDQSRRRVVIVVVAASLSSGQDRTPRRGPRPS